MSMSRKQEKTYNMLTGTRARRGGLIQQYCMSVICTSIIFGL